MRRWFGQRFALLGLALLNPLLLGLGIIAGGAAGTLAASSFAAAEAPTKNFVMHEAPRSIPAIAFEDEQGRARSLTDFRGKVVLLNIWATWCGPCRREMPALDRLQATLGGTDFEVVALSIDRSGIEVVRKFYAEVGVRNLAGYIDTGGKAPRELHTVGVPTTLLIDREGRELGRLLGPAEWDAPEMGEFLRSVISRQHVKAKLGLDHTSTKVAIAECSTRTLRAICTQTTANAARRLTNRGEAS